MVYFVYTWWIINEFLKCFFKRLRIHVWRMKIAMKKLNVSEKSVTV